MTILDAILAESRRRAAEIGRPAVSSTSSEPRSPSFADAIRGRSALSVIAEFKRRSPSAGRLSTDTDASEQLDRVQAYVTGGAAAISVLTEPSEFGGSTEDLRAVSNALPSTPILRKDFLVDPRQCVESRALGASAVLLIAQCLGRSQLVELYDAARSVGLDVLVECHDRVECEVALELRNAILGINNRNLRDLSVDTSRTNSLLSTIPDDRVVVAESGYSDAQSVDAIRGRADAVLVGSALMRSEDPARVVRSIGGGHER